MQEMQTNDTNTTEYTLDTFLITIFFNKRNSNVQINSSIIIIILKLLLKLHIIYHATMNRQIHLGLIHVVYISVAVMTYVTYIFYLLIYLFIF